MKPVLMQSTAVREIKEGKRRSFVTFGTTPPEYAIGDILYIQETWYKNNNPGSEQYGKYEYYADYNGNPCQDLIRWEPAFEMPEEAARIFLKVINTEIAEPKKPKEEYWVMVCEFERVEV